MPSEFLVCAVDLGSMKKGYSLSAKDDSRVAVNPWGSKQTLPTFIQVRVSDAAPGDLAFLGESWIRRHRDELVSQTLTHRRVRFSIRPSDISTSGRAGNLPRPAKLLRQLREEHDATLVSEDATTLVVDVPRSKDAANIRRDIADVFDAPFENRRVRFSSAFVDNAVAAGGRVTRTLAQINAAVRNRLDE